MDRLHMILEMVQLLELQRFPLLHLGWLDDICLTPWLLRVLHIERVVHDCRPTALGRQYPIGQSFVPDAAWTLVPMCSSGAERGTDN